MNYSVPLNSCSLSIASHKALKFPFPQEVAPFLCTLYKPICFLIFLSFFGLAKEDADMLDVRVKAVMFCSNG